MTKIKAHRLTKSMEIHAQIRARERTGAHDPAALCRAITQEIMDGNACRIAARSHRVSTQGVIVDNRLYVVVYDHKRHIVVTFIPKHDVVWNYARQYFQAKGVFYEE